MKIEKQIKIKTKINQGFLGGPTWVEYTPESQKESQLKLSELNKIIEQAGGFKKFLYIPKKCKCEE